MRATGAYFAEGTSAPPLPSDPKLRESLRSPHVVPVARMAGSYMAPHQARRRAFCGS